MTSSSQLIAAASDALRVYDFVTPDTALNTISTCNFSGALPSSLSWNHTNQVVAVGLTGRKIDLVQASNGQLLSTVPFGVEEQISDELSAVKFSGNSRYLASAGGNAVQLWDLKRRCLKTTLTGDASAVTTVSFFADGSIAAGDRAGCIRIWDIKATESTFQVMTLGGGATAVGVTCMQLSYSGPGRIAAGYHDGSLCLWDPVTLTQLRQQAVHRLRIASLAFSPKNPRLVATAGIDGRMALVDTGAKTADPSAAIDIGKALTAITFHEDAIHCAVGTTKGTVLVYDWRNVRKPVATIDSTSAVPVRDLSFQVPKVGTETASARRMSSASVATVPALTTNPSPTTTAPSSSSPSRAAAAAPTPASVPSPAHVAVPVPVPAPALMSAAHTAAPAPALLSAAHTAAPPAPAVTAASNTAHTVTATMTAWQMSRAASIDKQHYQSVPAVEEKPLPSAPTHGASAATMSATSTAMDERKTTERSFSSPVKAPASAILAEGKRPSPAPSSSSSSSSPVKTTYESSAGIHTTHVTTADLSEALDLLRYDVHREVQVVLREQVRQFQLAKEDTALLIGELSQQLQELLQANKELRTENERLRRIY